MGRVYGRPDTKTTYVYNTLRVIEELDDSDALAMEYVHGQMYIDEIILQDDQTTIYYFAHDRRYRTTALMNTSGSVVESYEYKVYGKRVASGSGLTEMGYTGRRHDSETGLMYFRNRYYSVDRGSFVTRDAKGYVDGYSMYLGYFGGQGMDPSGLVIISTVKCAKSISDYIKSKGVTNFIEKDGEFSGSPDFTKDGKDSEILGTMIKSKRRFVIAGEDTVKDQIANLSAHVQARANIVRNTTLFSRENVSFGAEKFESSSKYWDGLKFKAGVSPSDALADIVKNEKVACTTACFIASSLIVTQGIVEAYSDLGLDMDVWINKHAKDGLFKKPKGDIRPSNNLIVRDKSVDEEDWIPGDWGYVDNTDKNALKGLEGENIIYTSNGQLWGLFSSVEPTRTREQWLKEVGSWSDKPNSAELKNFRDRPRLGLK